MKLAQEAGISKEMLFFEILEDMHTEMYEASAAVLSVNDEKPPGGMELAAATVRGLFFTVFHRDNIGPRYPDVLRTLVYGACWRLFPE